MSTIVTRAGKGSALTHNEVDANFVNLNTDKIEAAQTVTLTNKTISGSNNTLSNIGNSSLTNSSVTIGSTSVSLGSTATTVAGLTLSSPTVSGGTINNASVGATTPSTGSFTSLTDSGNLTFTGTGNRITGDFSNATIANRVMFQTSTVDGNTAVEAIPNGTSTTTRWTAYGNSDPTNASFMQIGANGTSIALLEAGRRGTGTYLPMTFYTGGSEQMRIDTSGNVGIGTSSPTQALSIYRGSGTAGGIEMSGNANTLGTTSFFVGQGGDSSAFIYQRANASLYIGTNNLTKVAIDSSGNVGIGTLSPASFSGYTSLAINNATNGGVFDLMKGGTVRLRSQCDDDVGPLIYATSTYALRLGSGGSERMRIGTAGQLGIGGANYGTSGQVLMSQGASAAPVWGDAGSMTLLGTLTTTSGTSHTLSGLNLTPYKELFICFTNVSGNSGSTSPAGANALRIDSIEVQGPTANNYLSNGTIYLNLITGTFISSYWNAAAANESNSAPSTGGAGTLYYGRTSYSTATTSLVFSLVSASFDNGSITVYGVK